IISRSRKKFARKMLSEYERAGKILEDLNAGILPTIKQFKLLEKLDLVDRIDPIKLSSPVDPNKAREKVLDRLRSGRRIDQTNFPLIIEAARRGEIDPTGLSSRIVPGTGVRNTTIGFAKQSQTIDPDELTRKQILKRQIAADKRLLAVTTRAIDIAEQANTDRIISNKRFQFLQRQGRTDLLNPDVQIGSTRRPANTNPQFATSNVILPTAGNAPRPQGFIPFNSFNQSAQKFLKTQQQINTGMKDFGDQAFL